MFSIKRFSGPILALVVLFSSSSVFAMGMGFTVDGNATYTFNYPSGESSNAAFGGGAGVILPLGNRVGLDVSAQYTTYTASTTFLGTSFSASYNELVVPVSFDFMLGQHLDLLAGGYYAWGMGTAASGTTDDGLQGGVRIPFNAGHPKFYIDARYFYGLATPTSGASKTSSGLAMLGLMF